MILKVFLLFLLFGAFSTKRKRTTKAQIQKTNAKLKTPLLKKDVWQFVDEFLLPQTETKFNKIHRSFCPFPKNFQNISEDVKEKLYEKKTCWLFFKHFKTQKMFAQNVDKKNAHGETALHRAARLNDVEIANAVIEAGVDIDATYNRGWTAVHVAAYNDRLATGKVIVEAGADLKMRIDFRNRTPLCIALHYNHEAFAEMLIQNILRRLEAK